MFWGIPLQKILYNKHCVSSSASGLRSPVPLNAAKTVALPLLCMYFILLKLVVSWTFQTRANALAGYDDETNYSSSTQQLLVMWCLRIIMSAGSTLRNVDTRQ